MVFVASCPMMSLATDEAGESVVTQADCDEFVHRIFNMVSEIFSTCTLVQSFAKRWAPGLVNFISAVAYHFCPS